MKILSQSQIQSIYAGSITGVSIALASFATAVSVESVLSVYLKYNQIETGKNTPGRKLLVDARDFSFLVAFATLWAAA